MVRLTHPEKFSYEDVRARIEPLESLSDRALASLAYATGARVSELNRVSPNDLYFQTLKDPKTGEDTTFLTIICPVLKKRVSTIVERRPIVRLDEEWLARPIVGFADCCEDPTKPMFPFHRATLHKRLMKLTGWNPHGFRKLRATHLRRVFHYDAYQLKNFFEWSSISSSEPYVKLDQQDLAYGRR